MQAKRWLSGLVACAMLVTMLPTQVFALESDAADTWSKTLNAEELYALIQDKLDENGSIGLADLADSEAGTDTNDGVQGTLTAVAFDSGDKIELSALADGDTSYTLTFTDDDTSEPDSGLPAETGDMTEPPQEDGQPVAPGATPADDSTASDTTSGTDPPTAEEPSAQGQEGTVDLRVTTQETYATEAEADAQAAEQGKDPEADVAVQTDEETGTVLGALLTVDEEQVDKVTLTYTEIVAEDNAETQDNEEPQAEDGTPTEQPTNALSMMEPRWPSKKEDFYAGGRYELGKIPESAEQPEEAEGNVRRNLTKSASFAYDSETDTIIPGKWEVALNANIDNQLEAQKLELSLVIDVSNSMDDSVGGGDHRTRMQVAKDAAKALLTDLANRGLDIEVSIVTFGTNANVEQKLQPLSSRDLWKTIDEIPDDTYYTYFDNTLSNRGTNIPAGMYLAATQGLSADSSKQKVIVVLSDGDTQDDKNMLKSVIQRIQQKNIALYGIGFGYQSDDLAGYLDDDHYKEAGNATELSNAFTQIANELSAMIVDPMGDDVELVGDKDNVTVEINDVDVTNSDKWGISQDNSTIYWNPDGSIDQETSVKIGYSVQVPQDVKNIEVGEHTIALNGDARLNFDIGDDSYYQAFDVPQGYYSVGQLVEKIQLGDSEKLQNGEPHDPVYIEVGTQNYGADGQLGEWEKQTITQTFNWNAPDEKIEGDRDPFKTTYYYHHSYIKYADGKVSESFDARKTLETEAKPEVVTVVHVYSEKKPKQDSYINVEIYVDGQKQSNVDPADYVDVTGTGSVPLTQDESTKTQYNFQYEKYNAADTTITLKSESPYVIDAIGADVVYGQKGFNAMSSHVNQTEAFVDNIQGQSTVRVYLSTKYSVKYTGAEDKNPEDENLYVKTRQQAEKDEIAQYTNAKPEHEGKEDNANVGVNGMQEAVKTLVSSRDLSTAVNISPVPEGYTGWTIDSQTVAGGTKNWSVSEHVDLADENVFVFVCTAITPPKIAQVEKTTVNGNAFVAGDQVTYQIQTTFETAGTINHFEVTDTVFDETLKDNVTAVEYWFNTDGSQKVNPSTISNGTLSIKDLNQSVAVNDTLTVEYTYTIPTDSDATTLVNTANVKVYYDEKFNSGTDTDTITIYPQPNESNTELRLIVKCITRSDDHPEGEYTQQSWHAERIQGTNTYRVTLNEVDEKAAIAAYDGDVPAHQKAESQPDGGNTVVLSYQDGKWKAAENDNFELHVECTDPVELTVCLVKDDGSQDLLAQATQSYENGVTYQVSIDEFAEAIEFTTDFGRNAIAAVPKIITTEDGTQYVYMHPQEGSSLTGTIAEDTTVTLVYGVDKIGGEDPEDPGDGIPDQYQFTIEYVVADGQEAMGSVSPVGQNVYTIYQDGVLSAGPVTVSIDGDVIKAGVATAQDGYVFENWTLNDVDLSAIGVDDDLTGYQMMGVTGGQTYTFIAHFTKNYTVQDVLYSFVKEVTLADGVENFPASAEFKFALTKEGGSPTYEATTGEVSGMTAERSIRIVTDATDILADGTYYLTETVMDAGWTLTTRADGYKITIDHGTMSVNDEPVTEGETFAFVNTYNGAPSLEVEKTVVDAKGNPVSDDAVYRDGDQVYFKIAVTAKGGWPVEDVTVTDTLPAGLTVDAQAIQYPEFHNFRGSLTNVDGKTVEIRINTATPTEDTVWVIIPAIVDTPETYDADAYTNIAVIDDGDPDTEDPSGETTIQVEAVSVVKALTPNSPYNIGQTAQYYIVVTNTGNTVLNNLTVTEQLPEGLQLTDSEVNAGWNDGVYTIDFLNPGDSYQIWAEVQIMDYAESYPNVVVVKDSEETDLGQAEDDTLEVNPNHTVTVRYEWQDASGVTVGNETKATLEAAHDSRWKASVSDDTSQTLTDAADLVVAKMFTVDGKQYAFKGFAPAQTSGSVAGDVTITAVYGLDETGTTTDPEKPDGIPDEYQATVTYRVVNGTWSDGSSTDRTEVFTLYTYDPDTAAWTELEHVTLGDTIPTGMQANAGYVGQSGAWNTAITAETQVTGNVTYIYRFGEAAPNEIIVYYDDDGSGYGEVTSDHRQVFTAEDWQTITGDPTHVRIHLTATAEDDGGRTYFDEWQGSLVDDLDDDIREDEELSAWVVAEIGQTYTVIADFGRRSSGGGGGGGGNRDDDDEEEIIDEEVPLAETPWLNTVDHYAYIVGYAEDGTVRPNANITRAEVATIFFRLLTDEARNSLWSTTNTFSDVASTVWYNTAVSTMANAGIIQGYEDGTFRPNANITRAEFAAIAARFMTSGYDVESDLFTDIAGHWARESINDAATAGWINGYSDDTFRPDNAITRAEAVTLVNNVLQRKPDADHMLDSMITWPDNPESAWYYEAIQEATNSHDYDMPSEDDDVDYETWTALQENRDWAALEAQWSAEHAYGGDVM